MLLEWPEHDKKLTEGLTHLHQLNAFHDVTLSAEGKQIKAHRVVLASVSSYFKELLLSDTDDRFPIVFLKDVNFSDLESLIKFIYTGKTEVPATNLTSCTNLAETLGVKGFVTKIHTSRSPVKRKSTDNNHATSHHFPYFVKNSSEPISLPSHQNNANENLPTSEISQLKRRKVHSLGNLITDAYVVTPPHPFKTSTNPLQESRKSITTKLLIPKSPASPVKKSQHASYNSCPVESPTTSSASESSNRMLPHASALNNISFDSTFMDPSEMASKGANILHHLAMWMLEESKSTKTGSSSNILETASSAHSSSKLPPPPPPNNSLNRLEACLKKI